LFEPPGKHLPCRNATVRREEERLWGKPEKKRKGSKRGLNPKGTYADIESSGICFPSFVRPEVMIEEGGLT